jgi:MHS family proline/betaine transporter-like MFS transporter
MDNKIKSTLSSLIGNVLEWYEYTLYAYFSTVISSLFFPTSDSRVGMMLTFVTFAIGLAARPIGGIIFGYIGDKYSRKRMLSFTILLMSIPTLCIGVLPTYAQIGIFAPIILVTLRILQGIALGGEFGASCVYLYESAKPAKRGFFGALALTGVGTGLVLSGCTVLLFESIFTKKQVYAYAWRIPFFISVTGAIVGLYMRTSLLETSDFLEAKQNKQLVARSPFLEMLKNHKITLIKLFSIFLTTQIAFFVVFIFGKSMMIEYLRFTPKTASIFNILTVVSYTLSTLLFGYLSTKIDKRHLILFGTIALLLASYPFILSLKSGSYIFIIVMSIILGALIGMTEGNLNYLVSESFPTQIRATSVAFCWNFTAATFGAVAPIASMWLIQYVGNINAIAYYLMGACSITIFGILYGFYKPVRCSTH